MTTHNDKLDRRQAGSPANDANVLALSRSAQIRPTEGAPDGILPGCTSCRDTGTVHIRSNDGEWDHLDCPDCPPPVTCTSPSEAE